MLKRITYLEKRRDLSFTEFSEHWRDPHARIAKDLPGLACYLQNHLKPAAEPDADTDPFRIDGIVELWFTAPDVVSAAKDSHVAERLAIDEQLFLSGLTGGQVVSEDPHGPWPHKTWVLGRWSDGEPNEDAVRRWAESLVPGLSGLLGTNFNRLESGQELLTREALRQEPRIPEVAVAFGFSTEDEAQYALQQVERNQERCEVLENIRLYRGSEIVIVAPERKLGT